MTQQKSYEDKRIASIAPPNKPWPRAELEEMVERWIQGNIDAENNNDWTKYLGPFYTEDATYSWNIGPHEEFVARGHKQICDTALGYQMLGFDGWNYPYHDVIIDEQRGTVIGFWKQQAPEAARDGDGNRIEVAGIGGSWFEYAGDFKWHWQRDFFDFGNAKSVFFQLAGQGLLSDIVKDKIHTQARGKMLPGHEPLGTPPSMAEKVKSGLAMVKIALTGK